MGQGPSQLPPSRGSWIVEDIIVRAKLEGRYAVAARELANEMRKRIVSNAEARLNYGDEAVKAFAKYAIPYMKPQQVEHWYMEYKTWRELLGISNLEKDLFGDALHARYESSEEYKEFLRHLQHLENPKNAEYFCDVEFSREEMILRVGVTLVPLWLNVCKEYARRKRDGQSE